MRARQCKLGLLTTGLALSLAACTVGPGVDQAPTTSLPPLLTPTGTTAPATSGTTTTGPTGGATSTGATANGPRSLPAPIAVDKLIDDDKLGHQIKVKQVIRNYPWPVASPVSEKFYELVVVEMEWTAGSKYTAGIAPAQFSVTSGSVSNPVTAELDQDLQARDLAALPPQVTSGSASGWLAFKVEPKGGALSLVYNRPEIQVTNTGKKFGAASIPVDLAPAADPPAGPTTPTSTNTSSVPATTSTTP